MNAYKSQKVREKYKCTWQEEYIVGMVHHLDKATTTQIFKEAEYSRVMTQATIHKYLKSAVYRKLLKEVKPSEDRRVRIVSLTDKGRSFLNELEAA